MKHSANADFYSSFICNLEKISWFKIQFAKHKKLKKKEDQLVDTSFFLRMENKIPLEGVTKFRAEP